MKVNFANVVLFHMILAVVALLLPSKLLTTGIIFIYGFVIIPHYFKNNTVSKAKYYAIVSLATIFGSVLLFIDSNQLDRVLIVYLTIMFTQYPLRGIIQKKEKVHIQK